MTLASASGTKQVSGRSGFIQASILPLCGGFFMYQKNA
jgi:hypothetical protein